MGMAIEKKRGKTENREHALVAQRMEHLATDQEVRGSSPL